MELIIHKINIDNILLSLVFYSKKNLRWKTYIFDKGKSVYISLYLISIRLGDN